MDMCHAMIVDSLIQKEDGDYIRFKNTLQDDNQDEKEVEISIDSPELYPEFYFVHLKLKHNRN